MWISHHPSGRLIGNYRRRAILRENRSGVRIVRGWHALSESGRYGGSGSSDADASHWHKRGGACCRFKPDIVINYGPPLIGPLLASTLAWRFQVPLVTVIFDLYPDVAIETGKVTNPLVIAAARWAERRTYKSSDRIVVLSDGFRRTLIAKGVDPTRSRFCPCGLTPMKFSRHHDSTGGAMNNRLIRTTFVVLYAGTIGLVSGAQVMAEVAHRLRDEPNLLFLVVGDGQAKNDLEAEVVRRSLLNIRFCDFQDRDRLSEVQATADLSLVTLAPGRGRTSVPSKVIGYMAAGRPIVASVDEDSDTARCVLTGPCGIVRRPATLGRLLTPSLHSRSDSQRREQLGAAARSQFESGYAAPAVLERYADMLIDVVRGRDRDWPA